MKLTGIQTFTLIWFGQLMSLVGTAMTRFALIIWAYQQVGTATTVAMIGFSSALPYVIFSPIAGIVVDRFDRRKVMLWTDVGAGMMTIGLLGLILSDQLQYWHVIMAVGLSSAFETFQGPAYTAASTMLMPKSAYARASGMRSIAESGGQLLAPFFAAWSLPLVGLGGVLLLDVITFLVAVCTLSIVTVPHPEPDTEEGIDQRWWRQLSTGFRFILARPGLTGLAIILMGMNFADGLTYSSLLPVLILGKTGGSELALAVVQAALGIGTLVGGVLVSTWGGPKRQIHGVLLFAAISFLLGDGQLGLGKNLWQWSIGGFTAAIFIPAIIGAQRTIWQRKTPPAIQGRVFAAQGMLQQVSRPAGYLLAGFIADQVLQPALSDGGALKDVFGQWVGTGPGGAVALMFLFTAATGFILSLSGYLVPAVRNVEDDLPDYDIGITDSTEAVLISG